MSLFVQKKKYKRLLNCIIIIKFILQSTLVTASQLPTIEGDCGLCFLRVNPINILEELSKATQSFIALTLYSHLDEKKKKAFAFFNIKITKQLPR